MSDRVYALEKKVKKVFGVLVIFNPANHGLTFDAIYYSFIHETVLYYHLGDE